MKKLVAILTSCFIASVFTMQVKAQGFITPLESVQLNTESVAYKTDGKVIKGTLKSATLVMGYLKKVTILDNSGVKHKLPAAELKRLKVKPGKLAKMEMAAKSTEVPSQISKERYAEVLNREWLIYERTLKDKKKDVAVLGQLLNPGFDKKYKVFVDPNAKPGFGIGPIKFGGPKSYMIQKVGAKKSVIVKKGEYKKVAKELFGNCSKMMKAYEKFDYGQIAEHFFYYDQNCK